MELNNNFKDYMFENNNLEDIYPNFLEIIGRFLDSIENEKIDKKVKDKINKLKDDILNIVITLSDVPESDNWSQQTDDMYDNVMDMLGIDDNDEDDEEIDNEDGGWEDNVDEIKRVRIDPIVRRKRQLQNRKASVRMKRKLQYKKLKVTSKFKKYQKKKKKKAKIGRTVGGKVIRKFI